MVVGCAVRDARCEVHSLRCAVCGVYGVYSARCAVHTVGVIYIADIEERGKDTVEELNPFLANFRASI